MQKLLLGTAIFVSSLFLLLAKNALAVTVYTGNSIVFHDKNGSIAAVDPTTNELIRYIPAGSSPANLVASPDGKTVYVANGLSNTISVIDTTRQKVSNTFTLPAGQYTYTIALVLNSDGSQLYASRQNWPSSSNTTIMVLDTSNGNILNQIAFNNAQLFGPNIAFSPDGKTGYITGYINNNDQVGELVAFDTGTNQSLGTILSGVDEAAYMASAKAAAGNFLYVAYPSSSYAPQIAVINTDTNKLATTISLTSAGNLLAIASNPAGTFVYASVLTTNATGVYESYLYAIDTKTNSIATQALITTDYDLNDIALSADGKDMYVSASPNLQHFRDKVDGVYQIRAATLKILGFTSLDAKKIYPQGITIAN